MFCCRPDQSSKKYQYSPTKSYSPIIQVQTKTDTLNFLLDTGASASCINSNVIKKEENLEKLIEIQTARGIVNINIVAKLPLFHPYNQTEVAFVGSLYKLPFVGIIGIDIIEKLKAEIDLGNSLFHIPGKTYNIIKKTCRGCNHISIRDDHMSLEVKNIAHAVIFNKIF